LFRKFSPVMMMANANKLAPAYCSISSISTLAKDDDRSSVSSRSESTSAKSDDIETKKAQATPAVVTQTQAPAPRKVLPMQFSQINWQDLEGNREWRTVLCLRGLPACLCQDRALEAYLENCGLGQHVDKVKTAQKSANNGKKLGCAMVRAVSTEAVKELAKFFHGRQVGNSLIAVSFAPSQGLKAAAKQDTPKKIEKPSWPGARQDQHRCAEEQQHPEGDSPLSSGPLHSPGVGFDQGPRRPAPGPGAPPAAPRPRAHDGPHPSSVRPTGVPWLRQCGLTARRLNPRA